MEILIDLLKHYPKAFAILSALVAGVTWFCNNYATKLVSAIPMPTKDSSPRSIWWFQFLNRLVGNDKRADLPPLEGSPNFRDAVKQHCERQATLQPPTPSPAIVMDGQLVPDQEKK